MAINNKLLYNQALNGFVVGSVAARNIKDPTAAHYATLVAEAVQYAIEVDAAIPNDNAGARAISTVATGAALVAEPGNAAQTNAQVSKLQLVFGLVQAARFGSYRAPAVADAAATHAVRAAAIAAVYNETVASQQIG
jgi:hypothetical protein